MIVVYLCRYDSCNISGAEAIQRYGRMADALLFSGRPILYSIADASDNPIYWAPALANSWRTTSDIAPIWDQVIQNADDNNVFVQFAGPGGWNDPDMLEVGNPGLTLSEAQAHFSLWALMKAPLILGNDIRNMTDDILTILTNDEVIALSKDPLGQPGSQMWSVDDGDVWMAPIVNNSMALVLLNRGTVPVDIMVCWRCLGVREEIEFWLRDVVTHYTYGRQTYCFIYPQVPPHTSITMTMVYAPDREMSNGVTYRHEDNPILNAANREERNKMVQSALQPFQLKPCPDTLATITEKNQQMME